MFDLLSVMQIYPATTCHQDQIRMVPSLSSIQNLPHMGFVFLFLFYIYIYKIIVKSDICIRSRLLFYYIKK